MKDRIAQLIESEGLTPSKFADLIDVQRSSISHVLAGRNKPSLDFLQKIISTFPAVNTDWLLAGIGQMYKGAINSDSSAVSPIPRSAEFENNLFSVDNTPKPIYKREEQANKTIENKIPLLNNGSEKKIKKIVVIYDDFSMEEFTLNT